MQLVYVPAPLVTGAPPGVYRAERYRYDPDKYTLFGDDGEPLCNEYRRGTTPVLYGWIIPDEVWRIGPNWVCGYEGEVKYIRQRRAEGYGPDVADWRAMVGLPPARRVLEVLQGVDQDVQAGWTPGLLHRSVLRLCVDDRQLREESAKWILVGARWPYGKMPGERFRAPLPPTSAVLREWERWSGRKATSVQQALSKALAKLLVEIELTAPPAPVAVAS